MSKNDLNTLLMLLIPFFIFIIVLISFFLFKNRKRKLGNEYFLDTIENVSINMKSALEKRLNTNIFVIKIMPPLILLLMYCFIFGMIALGSGPEGFQDIMDPQSGLFKIALLVFILMSIGGFLAHLKVKGSISVLEKAIKLTENKPLYFKLNNVELTVPVMALTNPALWQATNKNMHEVTIPLIDIVSFEVYSQAGRSPSQYLIKLKGNFQFLGDGAFNGPQFGFGIKREYLLSDEQKILSFLKVHLGERFSVRDNLS